MARVMNRADVISQLKDGKEIHGSFWGYSMSGGRYNGWTVRSDTLILLLKSGLIEQEHDKISHYYHYRWKRSAEGIGCNA
jgi:hypothetical protein